MEHSRANKGGINEALVTLDLIEKGYELFRAVLTNTSCDLIALKDGRCLRVEVRTGYRRKTDNKVVRCNRVKSSLHDILALVVGKDIYYEPVLENL